MQKLKLLFVEDEEMDAALAQDTLRRSGMDFEAIIATDKSEFLSAIKQHTFDAILIDNSLPQFDAIKVLQSAKENRINVPLILVTGSVSEDFAVNIMKSGACDYIFKDRLQRLPSAIHSALEKHALEIKQQKYLDDIIKNEALMKESEQLAHLGSWESDLVTNTTYWSDENYRILDYEPGEVAAGLDTYLGKVHPDDVAHVRATIEEAINGLNNIKYECRVVKKDKSVKYIDSEVFITRDEHNKAIRVNGFLMDITESKLAEELLYRSEANLQTIFNNTETGYALLDTAFNVISFNQPVYNFSVEQMAKPLEAGKPAIDFFRPKRWAVLYMMLTDVLKGKTHRHETSYRQSDGSNKWFDISCHPVMDNEQKVIGIILSETEITKRKISELKEKLITEDLVQRNKVLEQFAYIISHNLRGPMTTIMGLSNVLEEGDLAEEDKDFFINGITESVKKLDNVVLDLNSIIQSRNLENEYKEEVSLSNIFKDVTSGMQGSTGNDLIVIKHDFSETNTMNTIKSYMHSIFYNLISNSIKYKKPGSPVTIEVSSKKTNNKTELIFKDNGMGIDLAKKGDQVFGLYKRFHIDAAEGKGMGLFMVKTQVETLGGKISINSEVNAGTEFTITFDQ